MAGLSVDGSGSFRNCPSKYGVRSDSSYDFWCKAWHPSGNRMGKTNQIILPALVLGLGTVAGNTRNMRASMLAITTQDYVKTARAKGLSPIRVVLKHQFKNSLVPIIPNLGVQIAGVLMGSFVVESMFLIPGLGRYFVDSVTNLDYPLIMGLTVFYGAFLVTMNLIVDVLYGLIDPRIRVK